MKTRTLATALLAAACALAQATAQAGEAPAQAAAAASAPSAGQAGQAAPATQRVGDYALEIGRVHRLQCEVSKDHVAHRRPGDDAASLAAQLDSYCGCNPRLSKTALAAWGEDDVVPRRELREAIDRAESACGDREREALDRKVPAESLPDPALPPAPPPMSVGEILDRYEAQRRLVCDDAPTPPGKEPRGRMSEDLLKAVDRESCACLATRPAAEFGADRAVLLDPRDVQRKVDNVSFVCEIRAERASTQAVCARGGDPGSARPSPRQAGPRQRAQCQCLLDALSRNDDAELARQSDEFLRKVAALEDMPDDDQRGAARDQLVAPRDAIRSACPASRRR